MGMGGNGNNFMGMGGNGNSKSHSRTPLDGSNYLIENGIAEKKQMFIP